MVEARRLGTFVAILLAVNSATAWVLVGYFGYSLTWLWSFTAADGWCDLSTEGFGIHCFGDYAFPLRLVAEESPWANQFGIPHSYTPTGMLPFVIFSALESLGLGRRIAVSIYLLLLALAMLVPIIWATRPRPGDRGEFQASLTGGNGLLLAAVLAVVTQPFIMVLDRGNSVGFVVPFLLLFALYFQRNPAWVAPLSVVIAASIRPQFALIAIALVAVRRFRAFFASVLGVIFSAALGFAFWPGDSRSHFSSWLQNLEAYQGYASLTNPNLANLSFARSIALVSWTASGGDGTIGHLGRLLLDYVVRNPSFPGAVLLVVVLVAFAVIGPKIDPAIVVSVSLALPALVPSVSFGYYSIFSLVLAAIVLRPEVFAQSGEVRPIVGFRWLLVAAIALTLHPFPLPLSQAANGVGLMLVGTIWSIVTLAGLALPLKSAGIGRWFRRKPAAE